MSGSCARDFVSAVLTYRPVLGVTIFIVVVSVVSNRDCKVIDLGFSLRVREVLTAS